MTVKIGQKAPGFKVNDQDGNPVRLSDFKGKRVVIFFYPKDQTPGCTAEACNLRDNYKVFQKKGYVVLGVSTDSEKSHQKFIEKQNLPFQLLADTEKVIHEKYGTWVEKSMYGRKYMGTARTTFIINEKGMIDEIISKVNTRNHADQILGPADQNKTPASKTKKVPKKKDASKKPGKKAAKKKK